MFDELLDVLNSTEKYPQQPTNTSCKMKQNNIIQSKYQANNVVGLACFWKSIYSNSTVFVDASGKRFERILNFLMSVYFS